MEVALNNEIKEPPGNLKTEFIYVFGFETVYQKLEIELESA